MHIRFWKTKYSCINTNIFHVYVIYIFYRNTGTQKEGFYYLLESRCDVRSNTIIMRHVLFNNVTLWKPWRRQQHPQGRQVDARLKGVWFMYLDNMRGQAYLVAFTSRVPGMCGWSQTSHWRKILFNSMRWLPNNNINEQAVSRSLRLSDSENSTEVLYCKHCSSHSTSWE